MTIDELLIQAKVRYPPGTIYWNLNLAGGRSNTHKDAKPHRLISNPNPSVEMKDFQGCGPVIARGELNGYVYSGGKWAEIVSIPYEIY